VKVAILGSGRGSNAEAILRKWRNGELGGVHPVAIFSDKSDAPILELGRQYGVPSEYIDPGHFKTKLTVEGEERFVSKIKDSKADIVVLAGFMRVLKDGFLNAFPKKIINLHPSLLPSFKGLDGIGQAWRYGVKITGCTVHFVTGDLDGGPIIDQTAVRIEEGESLESLEARIHAAEHALLPDVLKRFSEERETSS